MDFNTLVTTVRAQKLLEPVEDNFRVLCFDPGHTTGWALFVGTKLCVCGQINTTDIPKCVQEVEDLFAECQPDQIVMEDYRVYAWRAKHHAGSDMLTTRVIGSIETIAVQHFIADIIKQPAHIAKKFCTDAKLRAWNFHQKGGLKHANDAIRHGCYYLIFGAIRKADKARLTVG